MPEGLHRTEFVALMAMLFATIAFSVDAMLPALPEIADDLTPETPNRAQLIITSFVLGMGIGTMFTGPLSDAFGRKPVIVAGSALFVAAAALAWWAESLELVLIARVIQGLGAAAPRVVAMAIIRDLYEGRRMAQLVSFVMMVFALVPAAAPAIGAGIIALTNWRGIFVAFILFSLLSVAWLILRQPETLAPEARRPFRARPLWAGIVEVVGNRQVLIIIAALSLVMGMLFTTLSLTQPVFDETFGRGETFHFWFAGVALISATGSLLNARIVIRFGMRRVAAGTLLGQGCLSAVMIAWALFGSWDAPGAFALFFIWTTGVFFSIGLTLGNLNALAMEPLGHLAGMAASIIGSISTVAAVAIAVPVGLAFNGTPVPGAVGAVVCCVVAYALIRSLDEPEREPVEHGA